MKKKIKSCKVTNLEFLELKRKIRFMPLWRHSWWTSAYFNVRKNFYRGKNFHTHDVKNKQLKEENEKLRKEENKKLRKEETEKLRK